ncbi:hypothetical protein HYDPIDRAFT_102047 [Hydnomerulius pinastri MD-312]|uniref:Uncharacterized protein n=1 Tax=Hydnomerulius pinastri MD-312 TaxID=994086 RepID=A0A0C9VMB9_9AGAM|nr:hypothetical protein HYDPIDRAFT_102050 [Hydnomerulius pinastri MD-312]KIJ58780.1 hypothetical protein HYDPIDRAFT_102047 [Hydnomerulius pinastri MD-312]
MHRSTPYSPTISDILKVRRYFTLITHPLPTELTDVILNEASYWAHSSITVNEVRSVTNGSELYLRTLPLACPQTEGNFTLAARDVASPSLPQTSAHPCRMIEFQIWGHDQGWSSYPEDHGTHNESWTWFSARVEEPIELPASSCMEGSGSAQSPTLPATFKPKDLGPPSDRTRGFVDVQTNIHAKGETTQHTVTWHYLDSVDEGSPAAKKASVRGQNWKALDGKIVNGMRPGDCIALWINARYPGWRCTIEKAKITVYWAV